MGILGLGKLDPKGRTEACSKELTKLMEKYNCMVDIQHRLVIVPLEDRHEVVDSKTKN